MTGKQPKRKPRIGIDEYGRTPLHYASNDGNAEKVKELLASGADPNVQDDNGWTPLHFAAQAVSAAVAELLLAAGANVTAKDSAGNIALWRAVFCSKENGTVIAALRKAGANPFEPNIRGISPFDLAHGIGNFNVKQFFNDIAHPAQQGIQPDEPASGGSAG